MADGAKVICAAMSCQSCGVPLGLNPLSPVTPRFVIPLVRRNGQIEDIAAGDKLSREYLEPAKLQLLLLNEGPYLQIDSQTLPLTELFAPLLLRLAQLEERVAELEGGA